MNFWRVWIFVENFLQTKTSNKVFLKQIRVSNAEAIWNQRSNSHTTIVNQMQVQIKCKCKSNEERKEERNQTSIFIVVRSFWPTSTPLTPNKEIQSTKDSSILPGKGKPLYNLFLRDQQANFYTLFLWAQQENLFPSFCGLN